MNTSSRPLGSAWIAALVGAWLVISPFVLHFSSNRAATIANILLGVGLIICTLLGAKNDLFRGLLIMLAGGMYTCAFMIVVHEKAYLWTNLLLGILVIVAAVMSSTPYPDNYVPSRK